MLARRMSYGVLFATFLLWGALGGVSLAAQDAATVDAPAAVATEAAHDTHADATHADHAHEGHDDAHAHGEHEDHAISLPMWSVLPFVAILLCIAVLPLVTPHWWEHNTNRAIVSFILAAPVAAYLYFVHGSGGLHALEHSADEYISFILLLGSLYVISGGIYVKGSLAGTPIVNTGVMALGGLIASFIGTTGASMLLIRPLLRANAPRERKAHIVVFFIFIVSNCGGLLTPLGDPPLFLGFLRGVPFTWTFSLWAQWLMVNGLLLVIFNVYDQIVLNKEELERPGSQLEEVERHEPLRVMGLHNFVFLFAIVVIIYASGLTELTGNWHPLWDQAAMLVVAVVAYAMTKQELREKNRFTFAPIVEVAILFAGIFVTMIPAMKILEANGTQLGLAQDWHFFWATGILSSFLDNAPTYLVFTTTASAVLGSDPNNLATMLTASNSELGLQGEQVLAAISCGAVFMGANTYIGNGPNFMVKAIAEENGVKMPSFFGYMAYSVAILVPILVLVTFVFFR
jgi:Na+/H+ antiporter NhaD/arsenite permease-like protein